MNNMASASQAAIQYTTSGIQSVSSNIWGPKSLVDLVRGIRSHKKDEAQFIATCMQEIKEEIKQEDHASKSTAVQKLTYVSDIKEVDETSENNLQMLGYDVSWSSFNIVEVMSQPSFTDRRTGCLGAAQTFTDDTKVVVLCTSLLKRALTNPNQYECGLAINCLANICTPDLARDLAGDVVNMLNSFRPYLRKKAVLVLYKIFLKWHGALRPAFPRLKERLEDQDPAVVSSAVNVICELARKNPKNYLTLAPTLFKVLQTSSNNWMLIKIIKLFSALCPLEKRLARRLIEPLTNIINTTSAMSLLYECIQTCIIGMPTKIPLMKLCIQKLRIFVEDADQNLKYLGLLALNNIMKVHPKAVAEHRDLVVKCLDDPDETIRLRALDLLAGMINSKNIRDIVERLYEQLEKTESNFYRDELIFKIIEMCSLKMYKYVADFEWYISTLMSLVESGAAFGSRYGKLLSSQFMDVMIRVESVREFGISEMLKLLKDTVLFTDAPGGNNSIQEVLYAAAWLIGEFPAAICLIEIPPPLSPGVEQTFLENKKPILTGVFVECLETLLHPRVFVLPGHIQAVFMQTILKLFTFALRSSNDKDNALLETLVSSLFLKHLPKFQQSSHIEVQERACFAYQLISIYSQLKSSASSSAATAPSLIVTSSPAPVPATDLEGKKDNDVKTFTASIIGILAAPLNPVGPTAQGKVPVPSDLDLTKQINIVEEPEVDEDDEEDIPWWRKDNSSSSSTNSSFNPSSSPAELPWTKQDPTSPGGTGGSSSKRRGNDSVKNPFLLTGDNERPVLSPEPGREDDLPPVKDISVLGISSELKRAGREHPSSRRSSSRSSRSKKRPVVKSGFEYHPGSVTTGEEGKDSGSGNRGGVSGVGSEFEDMDLTAPLAENEKLRQPTWPVRSTGLVVGTEKGEDEKKKESRERRDRRGGERRERGGERRRRSGREKEEGGRKRERGEKKKEEVVVGSAVSPALVTATTAPTTTTTAPAGVGTGSGTGGKLAGNPFDAKAPVVTESVKKGEERKHRHHHKHHHGSSSRDKKEVSGKSSGSSSSSRSRSDRDKKKKEEKSPAAPSLLLF